MYANKEKTNFMSNDNARWGMTLVLGMVAHFVWNFISGISAFLG